MSRKTERLRHQLAASMEADEAEAATLAATSIIERTDRETEGKRNLIKQLLVELEQKEQAVSVDTAEIKRYFLETVRRILSSIDDGHMDIIDDEKGYGFFQRGKNNMESTLIYWKPNTAAPALPVTNVNEAKQKPPTLTLKAKNIQARHYGPNLIIYIYDLERNTITVEQPDISTVFKQKA